MTDIVWTLYCATIVNKYFKKPYEDEVSYTEAKINKEIFRVNRPNHGLAHGLRQGLLAVQCINELILRYDTLKKEFREWLDKLLEDPNSIRKIQLSASFMRTGRQSEITSTENPLKYHEYERNDVKNFLKDTEILFNDREEQFMYARAITWNGDYPFITSSTEVISSDYLRTIFHISHRLDLRRITAFSEHRLKNDLMSSLKDIFISDNDAKDFMNYMWDISGKYLEATGDRDMVTKKDYYSNKFYIQAHNTTIMVKALHSI